MNPLINKHKAIYRIRVTDMLYLYHQVNVHEILIYEIKRTVFEVHISNQYTLFYVTVTKYTAEDSLPVAEL
jgi:hypothetical protein